jgi:hypothetical protein
MTLVALNPGTQLLNRRNGKRHDGPPLRPLKGRVTWVQTGRDPAEPESGHVCVAKLVDADRGMENG